MCCGRSKPRSVRKSRSKLIKPKEEGQEDERPEESTETPSPVDLTKESQEIDHK